MKVWGFIATCTASRAIHLDLTNGYSMDLVLLTNWKFTSLRGYPSEILSDQGSQLIAAAKAIADLTEEWDWDIVRKWAVNNRIT